MWRRTYERHCAALARAAKAICLPEHGRAHLPTDILSAVGARGFEKTEQAYDRLVGTPNDGGGLLNVLGRWLHK